MISKETILESYLFLREHNQSIPDETLDFMKQCALDELPKLKQTKPTYSKRLTFTESCKVFESMVDKACCKYDSVEEVRRVLKDNLRRLRGERE